MIPYPTVSSRHAILKIGTTRARFGLRFTGESQRLLTKRNSPVQLATR